jgi:prepilin-type N-terminal cleavage/methylation domain-containing protein/prepilin-type processing-associated H-X9-DG protein
MNPRAKNGFTLIELLVVVAIIGLLLTVILPALAGAREKSRTVVCISNLRQMTITASVYTECHDGYYPIAYYEETTASGFIRYNWDFTVVDDAGTISVGPGILWQGETAEKIQQCPSFKGNSNTSSDPYTGYNYNTSYIGHGQYEDIQTPAKASEVLRPSDCALFGDGQYSDGANKFMRAPLRSPGDRTFNARYAGTQGYRHRGRTDVAFCDGAAASRDKLYTNVEPARYITDLEDHNERTRNNKIGFLSQDNSAYDLR